ncbi:NAD(P)-dependent oxidoreductase [Hydrogenophaga sp.]|uniref:NAD(P)-dependent oxidoreductase n=1 Tax=Hydrogenophaga sp. TaxID=1904254 RepID=UPI00271C6535|nr:NAD(P)-dependent oxidoreductase [Hydrogenophaga sp.]MDO9438065.1 NAD(P)-dependent oxidoreductase [Hydrogenophaga sp.]
MNLPSSSPEAPAAALRVGIVGLGLMGTACATRLGGAGLSLAGYDVDPARRAAFAGPGRTAAADLAELATCDVVVLAVFDTAQVEQVVEGDGGLLTAARHAGCKPLVLCVSTCDPDRMTTLAQRCTAAGLPFAEMPISGTSGTLARGEAVGLVAGAEGDLQHAMPVLEALCPTRHFLGSVGDGSRAKLAVNLVLGLNRSAMAEGLVFARELGLDPVRFLDVLIGSAAYSRVMQVKGMMMATRQFEPLQGKVDQSLKDFHLILEQAAARGQALPFANVYAGLLEDCVARGESSQDNAFIVEAIARRRSATPAESQT